MINESKYESGYNSKDIKAIYKWGSISAVITGIMFLIKNILNFIINPVPTNGRDILAWIKSNDLALKLIPEAYFFAGIFLIPVIIALYFSLEKIDKAMSLIASGLLFVCVSIIMIAVVFIGRFVYPVYNFVVVDPNLAEFVIIMYYGLGHSASIIFGIVFILLSLSFKKSSYGKFTAYYSLITGILLLIIEEYPSNYSPIIVLVIQIIFSGWFVLIGIKIFKEYKSL